MRERQLERVRSALGGEPSLVLTTDGAALACDPLELVFMDNHGLQRLKVRDVRKVTHVGGELVVTGKDITLRGAFSVDTTQVKAFFTDMQTLRKRREAGLDAVIASAFSPNAPRQVPPPTPQAAPLESASLESVRLEPAPNTPSAFEVPSIAPSSDIPGFQLGLNAAPDLERSPPPRPTPPLEPAPAAVAPAPRDERPLPEPVSPALEPVADPWAEQPRVPKPNPRVAAPVQKESLPPPKANPRVAATPDASSRRSRSDEATPSNLAASAPPPTTTPPTPDAPPSRAITAPLEPEPTPPKPERAKSSEPRATERAPKPSASVSAKDAPRPRAEDKPRPAKSSSSPARSSSLTSRSKPKSPRAAVSLPKLPRPAVKLPDASALIGAMRAKVESTASSSARDWQRARSASDVDLLRRRVIAGAVDGAAVLVLWWLVTRAVGGRELETLLRAQADTGLLQALKDLLPSIISGALVALIACVALGAAYFVGSALSPLRGTPGERVVGVETVDVSGAAPTLMALGARYAVGVMLLLAPAIVGLLPMLVTLNAAPATLRSAFGFFGITVWFGVALLLAGQLPVFGARAQSLNEYLSDCRTQRRKDTAAPNTDQARA